MIIPPAANKWLQQGTQRMSQKFPLNLAAANLLPEELQKTIFRYMQDCYIWPQLQERTSYEGLWDTLQKLARINLDQIDLEFDLDSPVGKDQSKHGSKKAKVSDSIIFDTIDRLANINHFISFKNNFPAQFVRPDYIEQPYETAEYKPLETKIKAGNCILRWNGSNVDYYRKHLIGCRHHYTYGITFARSEFVFKVEPTVRQNNMGMIVQNEEVVEVGTTFDPISIRRMWLNYRLPAWNMDAQPCPFYFEETPFFATLQNVYDPDKNPFGFVNLDRINPHSVTPMYSAQEFDSVRKAMSERLTATVKGMGVESAPVPSLLKEEHSVNALWTFYPMLPLDPETGEWLTRADGTQVPYRRYIVQSYGSNLATNQVLLRLQLCFYPKNKLPIYGSAHMPDLDSGAYAPALGELLFNHYKEIVLCTNQFIANKNLINNPPHWVQTSSPAVNTDCNAPGAKIKVNGPNDVGWKDVFDGTASTVAMRQMLREEAQTTSKAVDAILGKAMGGRTSATEASNAYQASMSGITTDINLYNYDISGGFARRVWWYAGAFMDPDLLYAITGSFGFGIHPEDMWVDLDMQCNVGSNYIDSIVRQQNLRYLGEIGRMVPGVRMDRVFRALCEEMKLGNPKEFIDDGGWEREVSRATMQAWKTYMGQPAIVSPDQNHDVAIKVKTAFIEDEESTFNREHPEAIPALIQQIQIHQEMLLMQMQMQVATLQNQAAGAAAGEQPVDPAQAPPNGGAGGAAQNQGGTV